jgi:hypothetical protein
MNTTTPLTQVDVEGEIMRLCAELEDQVELFATVAEQRAEAEAAYKHHYSTALLQQQGKVTVSTREAVAHLRASKEFQLFRILEAREKATQQALIGIRCRLDSLRTIAANVRAAGG